MKKVVLALAAMGLCAGSAPAIAAPCKDAKGKFVKCPPPKPAPPKAVQCKDAKGKFVKCPDKPAKPKTCRDKNGKFVKC